MTVVCRHRCRSLLESGMKSHHADAVYLQNQRSQRDKMALEDVPHKESQAVSGIWADSIICGLAPDPEFCAAAYRSVNHASSELDTVASQAVEWVPGTDASTPGGNASNGNVVCGILTPAGAE